MSLLSASEAEYSQAFGLRMAPPCYDQASGTGAYDFTDVVISPDCILASAGDYLRQSA